MLGSRLRERNGKEVGAMGDYGVQDAQMCVFPCNVNPLGTQEPRSHVRFDMCNRRGLDRLEEAQRGGERRSCWTWKPIWGLLRGCRATQFWRLRRSGRRPLEGGRKPPPLPRLLLLALPCRVGARGSWPCELPSKQLTSCYGPVSEMAISRVRTLCLVFGFFSWGASGGFVVLCGCFCQARRGPSGKKVGPHKS